MNQTHPLPYKHTQSSLSVRFITVNIAEDCSLDYNNHKASKLTYFPVQYFAKSNISDTVLLYYSFPKVLVESLRLLIWSTILPQAHQFLWWILCSIPTSVFDMPSRTLHLTGIMSTQPYNWWFASTCHKSLRERSIRIKLLCYAAVAEEVTRDTMQTVSCTHHLLWRTSSCICMPPRGASYHCGCGMLVLFHSFICPP
jgi:hypothetical protein